MPVPENGAGIKVKVPAPIPQISKVPSSLVDAMDPPPPRRRIISVRSVSHAMPLIVQHTAVDLCHRCKFRVEPDRIASPGDPQGRRPEGVMKSCEANDGVYSPGSTLRCR